MCFILPSIFNEPIFSLTNFLTLVDKIKAAQYVRNNPGEVCPAKWKEGAETLKPSLDLVGKI